MLRVRILSAVVLLPVVLLLVYLGGIPWLAAVLVVGLIAWRELSQIFGRRQLKVSFLLGLVFTETLIGEAYGRAAGLIPADLLGLLLASLIIVSLVWALFDRREDVIADWGGLLSGSLYLGFLLGHFVGLRQRPDGLNWVLAALALVWTTDTMAYFVGSAIGQHRLWPRISPKKTWEGLIGGTLSVLVVAPWLCRWLLGLDVGWGVLLGLVVAILSPLGDLAVSLLKRQAHLKDSSQLIPGHGGILDRLDSLLFVVPAVFYFATMVPRP